VEDGISEGMVKGVVEILLGNDDGPAADDGLKETPDGTVEPDIFLVNDGIWEGRVEKGARDWLGANESLWSSFEDGDIDVTCIGVAGDWLGDMKFKPDGLGDWESDGCRVATIQAVIVPELSPKYNDSPHFVIAKSEVIVALFRVRIFSQCWLPSIVSSECTLPLDSTK
jgi:hypothetical protein